MTRPSAPTPTLPPSTASDCITEDGVISVEREPGPIQIPKTHSAAVSNPIYGDKWRDAMTEDYNVKCLNLKAWRLVAKVPKQHCHFKAK